jgi:hypothetical protein
VNSTDVNSVELGVKFQPDIDGFITGLRFYKGSLNTGTHVGSLWTSTGTLLNRTTFTNETASGWQEVSFSTPVAVTANTVYVASYFAPAGRYSYTSNYFATAAFDNPPLHALANATSRNGVYRYAAASTFPNSSFNSTNYWVDVVFNTVSPDNTPPTVTAVSPANGAVGVAVGVNTTATFSEPMMAASINGSTFELRDQNNALIPAAVTYDGLTGVATLNPTASLPSGRSFTATLLSGPAGVKDVGGVPMATDRVWFFKSNGTDTAAPGVSGFSPANGATNVSTTTTVSVTFNEAMNGTTINATTVRVTRPDGTPVPGSVTYDPGTKTATLTFDSVLVTGTPYAARVAGGSSGVKDLAGLALPADVTWSFNTGGPDVTAPTVASVTPTSGAVGVSRTSTVTVTFSEPMDGSTITSASLKLTGPGSTEIAASVTYNATTRVGTLTPTTSMAEGVTHTATVVGGAAGVKDVAGNPLAANFVWSFTTADTTAPVVIASAPSNGATGVSPTTIVTATFSEAMNGSTINGTTFRLAGPDGTHVAAGVAYNAAANVATLTPGSPLNGSTVYTATVVGTAAGVKDLAGNALQANFVWSFTTGDTTPPTVTASTPANGAVGVSPATAVTVTFSEAMNATTINVGTFSLSAPGSGEVSSSVVYNSGTRVATLTPSTPLSASTTYTVTVVGGASGVKDLSGNALAGNLTSSFTTGLVDTTAPTVTAFTPSNGATGVNRVTTVTASFSEAMNGSTITATTMTLAGPGTTPVEASVAYNSGTHIAVLTPISPLSSATTYVATVVGGPSGVTDLAGNTLASSVTWSFTTAATSCTENPIVCENQNAGVPAATWDVNGAGDPSIQGFATDISVNKGETVRFKIDTPASAYRLEIYRMGYYGGNGARLVATIRPTVSLPQSQPSCLTDGATGLIDCGNWRESASWNVPADAVSGIYFAKAVREDTASEGSHIVFVVRDDAAVADVLFQTSDTTWQAYNAYGGNSLYVGNPAGRAYKVSYNRPFATRQGAPEDWVFNSEYPMVRWLEANGYNVTYATGVDSDRRGPNLLRHKIFMSVGHDEYWSAAQRANVEAARDAGVHLTFLSGNEVFWKTRWENSIDGSGTPYRTLVCYKETHAGAKIDPLPNVWTGTWRDPRFSPPADGGRPENALTGTLFTVNDSGRSFALQVPEAHGKLRFWRNTSVATLAPGTTATLGADIIGYEWDEDIDNSARPAGLFQLSSTTIAGAPRLQDYGSSYGSGTATHTLTLYRHASGAFVFGAGTIQWSWGLDANHDRGSSPPVPAIQQATINLLADMGAQPETLQPGLVPASPSSDTSAPSSTITSPSSDTNFPVGQAVTITGTASDAAGGIVTAVEVSVDSGVSWRRANGTNSWTFAWTPTAEGTVVLKSRAVDDSGNLEVASAGRTVTVAPRVCPCSIWSASTVPSVVSDADSRAVELGVKFRADVAGVITGIRFYKGSTNTGTHTGSLWTSSGQLLASVVFTGETASGWQQADFDAPVAISANTLYVASYHTNVGRYSVDDGYFATADTSSAPLRAIASTESPNGVFSYGSGGFPTESFHSTNYWVDVVFMPGTLAPDTTPPTVTAFTPGDGAVDVSTATTVTVTFNETVDAATINGTTLQLRDPLNAIVPASVAYNSLTRTATLTPAGALAVSTRYTATALGGTVDPRIKDRAGNALAASLTWSFTTSATLSQPFGCPCTIWSPTATPAVASKADGNAVEVGVKFRTDVDGTITGIRFYKGTENTGTHRGNLWTSTGQLLATVTFTNETESGWQQANLSTPVQIFANTVYVASYHAPVGRYATDEGYFGTAGVDSGPLHALATTVSNNGVYAYGPGGFPSSTFRASNYWVDVVFSPGADTTPPTVTAFTPGDGASGVGTTTAVGVTFGEGMDAATINGDTFQLRDPLNAVVPASLAYNTSTRVATLTPTSPLSINTTYTATVRGGSLDPRVKDMAGNVLASTLTWSFTTSNTPTPPLGSSCPCTIWTDSATPGIAAQADRAVEVGVKFRSDISGYITGLRFYKGPTNTGTHVGKLWTIGGQLLDTVTFTNETASGWQQANFATPVPISANVLYVASYHAPVGFYALDENYFTSSSSDRPPLHAVASTESLNGVYQYGTGGFPGQSFNSSNYWVDVVFNTTIPPDTVAPTIAGVSPPNAATGVAPAADVRVTFSESMDPATISASSFELRAGGTVVPAAVTYDSATRSAVLNPADTLAGSAVYTLTVRGGSTDPRVKDVAGNALASNFTSSFSTATATAPPALGQGPGGPILVVTAGQNPFTTYYSEILHAEGLNLFLVADIATVNASVLSAHEVVILGEMPLTPAQVTMFSDWVASGGNLIAMRPDKQLSPLLGLADAASALSDAYIRIDTSAAPGAGLVAETIQFHGTADLYTLSGATAVATLHSSATAATAHPAVSLRSAGPLGGHAAAFTYDLARSVVYTRQGNPAWAGQERDGAAPIRSDDFFFGAATSQPDWIDFSKVAIPQADEQQRLLANLILHMNAGRRPLPRFWYLPRGLKAAVVMTGDDHGQGGTVARFSQFLSASAVGCSVENWECLRYTSYVYPSSVLSHSIAAFYHSKGFEIGVHVNTGCADYTPASLSAFFTDQFASFQAAYPSLPLPVTNRTHCIVFSDWATQPKVSLAHNVGLDTNYYYWPGSWINDRPGLFTGSGMPMRFADLDGSLIDVYQATTQMTDESGQSFPLTVNSLLDAALGPQGYYGVFTANMHTDADTSGGADAIMASAQSRGVPIVTARQMLEWVDGRNNSSFDSLSWNGTTLGFSISIGLGANGLQAMVPLQSAGKTLTSLTLNGAPVSFTPLLIKGVQWATFPAAPGAYAATYATPSP